ncbi:MAG: hypothetical protein ACLFTL_11300 [Alphaproteobacteria bacterium]
MARPFDDGDTGMPEHGRRSFERAVERLLAMTVQMGELADALAAVDRRG